jgi:Domain of unknown function (DUF4082)
MAAVGAVIALAAAGLIAMTSSASGAAVEALWPTTITPTTMTSSDDKSVEIGVRFEAAVTGSVVGIQFYKGSQNTGTHTGSLWTSQGTLLATVTFTNETASGWQRALFDRPVPITANTTYVASYHAPNGRYSDDSGYFRQALHSGNVTALRSSRNRFNGVRTYNSVTAFPDQGDWRAADNYWVSPLFTKDGTAPPTTSAPVTSTTTTVTTPPTTSTATTTTPTTTPPPPTTTSSPPGGGLTLPRVPWEGGPAYYSGFTATRPWNNPNFFPVGVWFESVLDQQDIDLDKAAGINTYVELTDNSNMSLIRGNGMYAITNGTRSGYSSETTGWLLQDEADMWAGPGSAGWTGNEAGEGTICIPTDAKCGYTVMQTMRDRMPQNDGRVSYANYGKGVIFWETDAEAEKFVNFTTVNSADVYWYTDPWACPGPGESDRFGTTPTTCRLAANYGLTMNRMRELDAIDGKRQPIYAFVEDGHPFNGNDGLTIASDQLAGAVMNSIIHEARGIIYFNHNFGGSCISQHVLRDSCGASIRPTVTKVNGQIQQLAPALNTQSYQYTFNPSLDTMLKAYGGSYYIFAMLGRGVAPGSHALTLPTGMGGASAEVMFENRSVPVVNGRITDTFAAESTYHIYKITP